MVRITLKQVILSVKWNNEEVTDMMMMMSWHV